MRSASLGAFCFVMFGARAALAEAPPPSAVRLEYRRDPGAEACPDEQTFRDAVAAQMGGREPFDPTAPDRLVIILARRGPGFEGSAELRDRAGVLTWPRRFPPTARCLDAVEDLAMAVSIRLTPPPERRPRRMFGHVDDPAPNDRPTPPVSNEGKPRPALLVRIGASGWLDVGTAPRPAAGVSLDVGLRWSWFSTALEAHWTPPAGAEVDGGADVRVTRLVGELVPCGHVGWFAGCAVIALGQVRGELSSADRPESIAALYVAGGARLGLEIPTVTHLAVRLAAELLGTRAAAYRLDTQTIWQGAPIAAGFGAGLVASF